MRKVLFAFAMLAAFGCEKEDCCTITDMGISCSTTPCTYAYKLDCTGDEWHYVTQWAWERDTLGDMFCK